MGLNEPLDYSDADLSYADRQRVFIQKLDRDVEKELWQSVFCNVPGFLEALFPVDDRLLSLVYNHLKKKRRYKEKASAPRWARYPTQANDNASVCEPFVLLVKDIKNALQCMKGDKPPLNDLDWRVLGSNIPATRDSNIPAIKPDIVATLSAPQGRVPWSRIVVPIEVKKPPTALYAGPAVFHLLRYIRLIFRESYDRRFVFGIVLAHSNVTVYLADRAGVVGSAAFDIHLDPKRFIRVIVGLLTFGPDRLGYDSSMSRIPRKRVYSTLDGVQPQPSYRVEWNEQRDEHYWLLRMPKPKRGAVYGVMDETEMETFVLYKAISICKGGIIRGRATRVWKAWLLDEMTKEPAERRVFVVKDTWNDDGRRLEGDFYQHVGRVDGIARLHSFATVRIHGEDDKVTSRIRRQLPVRGRPRHINASQPVASSMMTSHGDLVDASQYSFPGDYLPVIDVPEFSPRGKTHSRLVMGSYGWSIQYAKSLLELVGAVRDALQGYRAAYERGVLHCDMGVENILINRSQDVKGNRGFIIDFDHAKFTAELNNGDSISGTPPFISGELLGRQRYGIPFGAACPLHAFQHDLESVLWTLLWICLCKCGAGAPRPVLTDRRNKLHEPLVQRIRLLFQVQDARQLGYNKEPTIMYSMEFERCLMLIDDFYAPLKPMLWRLWTILNAGYVAGHFDFASTMDQFTAAFDEAEHALEQNPPVLTPEQEANIRAEEARRAQDVDVWEDGPRTML